MKQILWEWGKVELLFPFLCEEEEIETVDEVQAGNVHDSQNFTYKILSVMHAALVKYPVAAILVVMHLWEFCHKFERNLEFSLNLYFLKKHFCTY